MTPVAPRIHTDVTKTPFHDTLEDLSDGVGATEFRESGQENLMFSCVTLPSRYYKLSQVPSLTLFVAKSSDLVHQLIR